MNIPFYISQTLVNAPTIIMECFFVLIELEHERGKKNEEVFQI